MHNLLVTRRTVPLDRWDEYLAAWRSLAAAAQHAAANAWLFRRGGRDDQLVEFLEWRGDAALADQDTVLEARRALDEVAPAATELLEEVPL